MEACRKQLFSQGVSVIFCKKEFLNRLELFHTFLSVGATDGNGCLANHDLLSVEL